jgi:hypothetical protein
VKKQDEKGGNAPDFVVLRPVWRAAKDPIPLRRVGDPSTTYSGDKRFFQKSCSVIIRMEKASRSELLARFWRVIPNREQLTLWTTIGMATEESAGKSRSKTSSAGVVKVPFASNA